MNFSTYCNFTGRLFAPLSDTSALNGSSSLKSKFGFGSFHNKQDYETVSAASAQRQSGVIENTNGGSGGRYQNAGGGGQETYDIPVGAYVSCIE